MAKLSPLVALPPVIFLAFVGMAAIGMMRDDPNALPSARVGQAAPPVVLTPMPGKVPFTDATLRDGEVKLVNFWASWCAPCRVEHPNLEALAEDGLKIYGINYKDAEANGLKFLAELGDPYAGVAADREGRTGLDWGVYGVPETYVIDGQGQILLRHAGPVTERVIKETLRPALEAARAK